MINYDVLIKIDNKKTSLPYQYIAISFYVILKKCRGKYFHC